MKNRYIFCQFVCGLCLVTLAGFALLRPLQAQAGPLAQQPTVSIPTVTSTPLGPMVSVNLDQEQIKVRAGPGFEYPEVGILVQGQTVPAYGASIGSEWIQIGYLGIPGGIAWVNASLVSVSKVNQLAVVTPPATPTPRVTPTLDPTLAAMVVQAPTRLPTFTAAPPLIVPTFASTSNPITAGNLPVGFVIVGLAVMGLFGMMLSILRGR